MAARFFVNGAGDFSWANPLNWALTSGGAGGQGVPTSADDVTLDLNSPTCYLTAASDCKTLTITSGFVNIFGGFGSSTQNLTVAGTTGTVLAITPGAGVNSSVSYVAIYVDPIAGSSVNVNINLGSTSALISTTFYFTLTNTATVTLLTNGVFARTADLDERATVLVYSGTFSTGTVNPTFGNLTCYGGTCNFNASVVTMAIGANYGANFTFSAQNAPTTVALGTSVINGAGAANFQEPSINIEYASSPITITVGATQTLNVRNVSVKPSVSTTLRTITARRVSFIQPSGANITAGAVTANEYLTAIAEAGYTTLPTLTLTSITGTNSLSTDLFVNISEVGFTCGAISLTYSGSTAQSLSYTETSKGTVNVTGAITLTDNSILCTPLIDINTQAAFTGSPTVTYTGLNASVRGMVRTYAARAVSLGAITAQTFNNYSLGGNVTTTTITLGGTLSAVVYDGTFLVSTFYSHAFQSTTIGPGTGALVDFYVSTIGNFTATAITAHKAFSLLSTSGAVSLTSIAVTANSLFSGNLFISGASVTLTGGITFSGSVLTTANFIEIGSSLNPIGPLSIGGAVTTGSSATNRLALIIRSAAYSVAFANASIVHSVSQLIIYNNTTLTWGATQTLNLNQNAALSFPTVDTNPLSIESSSASTIGLPATLTSTYSDISKKFYISTPNAAVTFSATAATLGSAAGSRGIVDVAAASYSCGIALDTSGFSVIATGAITQSGIVTISSTSVTSPSTAIYVSAGTTSTFQGLNASAITDTGSEYVFSFLGAGALTIASTITGPTATNVRSRLSINKAPAPTTFSGAISAINTFEHVTGNLVFTGALAIGVRRYVIFTSGYTLTPNTSVITISGTSTVPNENGLAILDHGGYTLNSVIFSSTASQQYIRNTTSANILSLTSLTTNGAAVPYSFLVLATDVFVSGSQLTIAPNSITNRHLVCSNVIGTPRVLNANSSKVINAGVDFQDIAAVGSVFNLSGISAGDAGGNSGISFSVPASRTLAITTGSVNWDATTTWSSATVPLAHDNVNISAGTATLVINTNNRVYLGNVTFGTFAGDLVVSNVLTDHTIVTGNSFNFSTITGVISASRLTFISRSSATFFPPSTASVFAVSPSIISTLSLTMAGANDLNVNSAAVLAISSLSFSTNTGTRICNISNLSGSVTIGSSVGTYTSVYNAAVSSNIASSTIYAGGAITIRNCVGTTPSISTFSGGGIVSFQDSVSFTNATVTPGISVQFDLGLSASNNITLGSSVITAKNVLFNAGFTLNSASATINVSESINQTSTNASTWVEGTTQINFTGSLIANLLFRFSSALSTSTVYRVTINDAASAIGATNEIFLDGLTTNPAIRFFNSSAMLRPLRLGTQRLYGGLNAVFSNKAYTYLKTPSQYTIVGPDPLYIPYAFCSGANVLSGSIVAYGPANLGGNVGNITFPSRLRYYAFVNTTTTMTVPNDYNGMGLLLAVGGGATPSSIISSNAGKGGGGGGGISYTFLLSPNNLTAPVVPGQTIYINAGAYAVAPVANTIGGAGNVSWANVSANSIPVSTVQGVRANGGSASTTSTGGLGGSTTNAIGHITTGGGSGSSSSEGGGGGGSARFNSVLTTTTNIAGGGGGTLSTSTSAGRGGNGSVTGGSQGTAGLSPTAGADGSASTGAGGGGGGGNTYNPVATTTTTNVTRANGSTTMVFNVTSHGFLTGDRITLITSANPKKSGNYSKSSSTSTAPVTVSITAHGLVAGNLFYFDRTSGTTIPSGTYTVATATTNTFTFVANIVGTTSGNCRLGQAGLANNTYYSVTVINANQFTVTGSVSSILYAGQYEYNYRTGYIRAIYNGANGGSGALNSAENFIRYYNNVYTPGYFGIGGGGGGGGSIVSDNTNYANQSGNGGSGGIGSGGGGIGVSGLSIPSSVSATAISGRGGPGLVMFIYALRANNQPLIQGV